MYQSHYSECDLNQISAPIFIFKKLKNSPRYLTVFNTTKVVRIEDFKPEFSEKSVCKIENGFVYDMDLVKEVSIESFEVLAKSKWRNGIMPIMNVLYVDNVKDHC